MRVDWDRGFGYTRLKLTSGAIWGDWCETVDNCGGGQRSTATERVHLCSSLAGESWKET